MSTPESDIPHPASMPLILGVGALAVGAIAELSGNSGFANGADAFGLTGLMFAAIISGSGSIIHNRNQNHEEVNTGNTSTQPE